METRQSIAKTQERYITLFLGTLFGIMTLVILNDSMTLVDQHGCYIEYFKHNLKEKWFNGSNLEPAYYEMVKKSAMSKECRI